MFAFKLLVALLLSSDIAVVCATSMWPWPTGRGIGRTGRSLNNGPSAAPTNVSWNRVLEPPTTCGFTYANNGCVINTKGDFYTTLSTFCPENGYTFVGISTTGADLTCQTYDSDPFPNPPSLPAVGSIDIFGLRIASGSNFWSIDTCSGNQFFQDLTTNPSFLVATPACVGTQQGCIVAYEDTSITAYDQSTGDRIWTVPIFNAPTVIDGSIAVDSAGTIFIAYITGDLKSFQLTTIDSSGTSVDGRIPSEIFNSPSLMPMQVIVDAGTVFVTGGNLVVQVVALDAATRTILWSSGSQTEANTNYPLTVSHDTVYISYLYTLVALDRADGAPKWTVSSNIISSAPAIGDDGLIYLAQLQSNPVSQINVLAISADTSDKAWEFTYALPLEQTLDNGNIALAIGAPGQLIITSTLLLLALDDPASTPILPTSSLPYAIIGASVAAGLAFLCLCSWCVRSNALISSAKGGGGGGGGGWGGDNPFLMLENGSANSFGGGGSLGQPLFSAN